MKYLTRKQIRRQLTRAQRRLTASTRVLPDFLILGGQKCGTSSLFRYLIQHPNVHGSDIKEVHYFDGGLDPAIDTYTLGENWYKSHFPIRTKIGTHDRVGEASPLYLFSPIVPERIFQTLPNARLIVLLRDPVKRAISNYQHEKRRGREDLPMSDAFAAEADRLSDPIRTKNYRDQFFIRKSYKLRGHYAEQLSRYFSFFPREQFLIIESNDFFCNTEKTLESVFEFLEVAPMTSGIDMTPVNVSTKSDPSRLSAIEKELSEYYSPYNEQLFSLLGESYEWL